VRFTLLVGKRSFSTGYPQGRQVPGMLLVGAKGRTPEDRVVFGVQIGVENLLF
jgi:hypothetical protein